MKNITISIDDDLYRQARMKAAEQSTSISAMFKNSFIRLTVGESAETEFQRLAREEQELRAERKSGPRKMRGGDWGGLRTMRDLQREEVN